MAGILIVDQIQNSSNTLLINSGALAGNTVGTAQLQSGITVAANTITANTVTTSGMSLGGVSMGAGDASIMKNHLINGAMQVWQRGTTQTFTNAIVYGSVDRWAFIQGGGSASISQTQSTSVPSGFQYSVKQQRTASSTTTGTVYSIQEIESVNCYDMAGQTATFSFWAKCGANFSASGSTLTSLVYQGTGTDQGTTSWISGTWTSPTSNTQSNTLTTTWQRFSQTVTIGASTTEILVSLQWVPVGTAGSDDSVYFTGVQLEVGSSATGFEYRQYGQELALCQRYFNIYKGGIYGGFQITGSTLSFALSVPVSMRTSPTFTTSITDSNFSTGAPSASQWAMYVQNSGWSSYSGSINTLSLNGPAANSTQYNLGTYGCTLGSGFTGFWLGSSNYFSFNAEL